MTGQNRFPSINRPSNVHAPFHQPPPTGRVFLFSPSGDPCLAEITRTTDWPYICCIFWLPLILFIVRPNGSWLNVIKTVDRVHSRCVCLILTSRSFLLSLQSAAVNSVFYDLYLTNSSPFINKKSEEFVTVPHPAKNLSQIGCWWA